MRAFHYRENIPPWHTQNMGTEIAEELDLRRWLLQEWNIPKHSLLKEFELIVLQLSIFVQYGIDSNSSFSSLSVPDYKFSLITAYRNETIYCF
ncbi:hypothetical protein AB3S75_033403 [Citrus x aurantiifolia]